MKRTVCVAAIVIFFTALVFAKSGSIGIYAVIDDVVMNPDGSSPDLVRISGLFVIPRPMTSGQFEDQPRRGYLLFRIPAERDAVIRKDLAELKAIAGTGRAAGFAEYWVANPNDPRGNPHHSLVVHIHQNDESPTPDVYPVCNPRGVVKTADNSEPLFQNIVDQLQKAARGGRQTTLTRWITCTFPSAILNRASTPAWLPFTNPGNCVSR